MWPRDILPQVEELRQARIMTYDYNSKLFDRNAGTAPDTWARALLRLLEEVRCKRGNTLQPPQH